MTLIAKVSMLMYWYRGKIYWYLNILDYPGINTTDTTVKSIVSDQKLKNKRDRQTDRQNFDTIYGWVGVFFSSQNFLPPLLASLAGG